MSETAHHAPISLGSPRFTTREAGGFTATDIWFPPMLTLPAHSHERTVLAITLSGSIDARLGSRRLESGRQFFWTEPSGERHTNHIGNGGARVVVVQPSTARRSSLGGVAGWLDEIHHRKSGQILELAHRLRAELHGEGPCSELMIESLALDLVVSGYRGADLVERTRPPFASRAWELIQERFRESLSVSEIADDVGVHPAHLTKTFRRFYGRSVGQAVRDARIGWAADRVRSTKLPLSQIAHEAGFADQSHMNRWIRRRYGTTPGALRKESDR